MVNINHALFWKLFNFAGKVVGILFALAGSCIIVAGIILLVQPTTSIAVNGVPQENLAPKLAVLFAGVIMLFAGLGLVMAKPYWPKVQNRDE